MDPSQFDRLMAIADSECAAFHDAQTAFVDVESHGHRETWPVRSREFTLWLQHRYFDAHRGAPNRTALRSALDTLEAQGRFEGVQQRVFRRVASLGNHLYLDLANSEWKAVEIGAEGWRVVDRPPVRFTRSQTTRALPTPASARADGERRDPRQTHSPRPAVPGDSLRQRQSQHFASIPSPPLTRR